MFHLLTIPGTLSSDVLMLLSIGWFQTPNLYLFSHFGPWNKSSLNFIFLFEYVIPKKSKGWPLAESVVLGNAWKITKHPGESHYRSKTSCLLPYLPQPSCPELLVHSRASGSSGSAVQCSNMTKNAWVHRQGLGSQGHFFREQILWPTWFIMVSGFHFFKRSSTSSTLSPSMSEKNPLICEDMRRSSPRICAGVWILEISSLACWASRRKKINSFFISRLRALYMCPSSFSIAHNSFFHRLSIVKCPASSTWHGTLCCTHTHTHLMFGACCCSKLQTHRSQANFSGHL